mmetsp:Transcript_44836/g.133897  ORF Transcript_44836/g.133897 Transcript_44836/m.133897 type:complete len:116 (+) Transcript_44836:340-687(+)
MSLDGGGLSCAWLSSMAMSICGAGWETDVDPLSDGCACGDIAPLIIAGGNKPSATILASTSGGGIGMPGGNDAAKSEMLGILPLDIMLLEGNAPVMGSPHDADPPDVMLLPCTAV